MEVEFVASFSPIVEEPGPARTLYGETLGIAFQDTEGVDYVYTERLDGVKHLGLWPLREAALACFGVERWPDDLPRPQASLEFEVADVEDAAGELREAGYELIHGPREEPWGQVIARFLSTDGMVIGVCRTPHLRPG